MDTANDMASVGTHPRPKTPDGQVDVCNSEKTQVADNAELDHSQDALPSTTRFVLLAVCLTFANVVESFGSTGVTVMLDEIAETLGIAENNLQWIFNSVQLPFVSIVVRVRLCVNTRLEHS